MAAIIAATMGGICFQLVAAVRYDRLNEILRGVLPSA